MSNGDYTESLIAFGKILTTAGIAELADLTGPARTMENLAGDADMCNPMHRLLDHVYDTAGRVDALERRLDRIEGIIFRMNGEVDD